MLIPNYMWKQKNPVWLHSSGQALYRTLWWGVFCVWDAFKPQWLFWRFFRVMEPSRDSFLTWIMVQCLQWGALQVWPSQEVLRMLYSAQFCLEPKAVLKAKCVWLHLQSLYLGPETGSWWVWGHLGWRTSTRSARATGWELIYEYNK